MVPVMRSTTPSTAASSASGGRMSMTSYSRIPPPLVFAAPCGEQEWTRSVYRPGPPTRPDPSRGLRQSRVARVTMPDRELGVGVGEGWCLPNCLTGDLADVGDVDLEPVRRRVSRDVEWQIGHGEGVRHVNRPAEDLSDEAGTVRPAHRAGRVDEKPDGRVDHAVGEAHGAVAAGGVRVGRHDEVD